MRWWLTRSAVLLARTRPLGFYPGWRFGIDEARRPDRLIRRRLRVWRFFHREGVELPITVPWYEGLQVRLHLGNDLSRCLYVGGCYEPNEFAFLHKVLAPGMTFADAGANDGLYAMFAARRVGPAGAVLAFEPSTREFERLQDNLRLNEITNVRAFRTALGRETGVATLRTAAAEHAGQNTLGQFVYAGVECARLEQVPVERLDDVVAREGVPAPDVIKMDVEGAEFAALLGARGTLEANHPLLLLELNDEALWQQQSSAAEVLGFLRDVGYAVFTFDPTTGRPVRAANDAELSPNVVAAHPARPWRSLEHG
jgi:FkbM family methyltransferase